MADKKFNITFDVDANITPVKNAISGLQSALSKINIPENFKKGLTDTFTKLDNEIKNFESIASKGFTNLADVNKAEKSFDRVTDLLSKLRTEAARLKGVDPNKLLPKETIDKTKALHSEWVKLKAAMDKGFGNTAEIAKQNQELDKQNNKLEELQGKYNDLAAANKTMGARRGTLSQSLDADTKKATELVARMQELEKVKGGNRTAEYKQLSGQLEVLNGSIKRNQTEYDNLGKKINENKTAMAGYSTQITSTGNTISQITATIEQLKSAAQQTPEGLNQLREKLAEVKGVNLNEIPTDIDAIGREIQDLNVDQVRQLTQSIDGLEPPLKEATNATQGLGNAMDTASGQMREMTAREKEIEQLANRVKYFFSIGNTVQLFKRAVKSAINTVKELDEVMTQAAVVTKFDVSGMWAQLPEYTKRANELGVTVKGVYEASTLYYQQGLETEQVIGVTNETLKMAKIAGLDYATATNYMTSALRGFNMEVNELSAQKVNDIYSQLAAKTASNVEEISIAMSKVAPLAHNAGMEIETTAAMLAQMIEKTREAPETLGTAMKTVIARFQELKKDPALIEPVDGEMVDANKVETALNTIGVALRDTSGQFRQLDEVFLEISQKWDTLDVNTQRYIATIAAGSRQQSRFIAMMADYARTTDLVKLANNSAGASSEQFEKTQASLATALNRLKNAWDQFAMGLANNEVIKKVIDLITGFINIVNKAIDTISRGNSIVKSILNLGALLGGIKLAKAAFTGFFNWLLKGSKLIGAEAGASFGANIRKSLKSLEKAFAKTTWVGPNLTAARVEVQKLAAADLTTADAQDRLSAAQAIYNRLLKESISGLTLTNAQQAAANTLIGMGVDETLAQAAALSGLTKEEVDEIITKGINNKETEEQITARLVEVATIKTEAGAEAGLITTQKMGILTRLKYIGLLIFGTRKQREDAFSKLGMAGATATATAAQEAFNASLYACPIGWIIAGILALVAAMTILVVLVAKKFSLTEKMKNAAKETDAAKESANEAKQAYDDLLGDNEKYDELQKTLEDLTYGTIEWKQALVEVNNQVLELINKYPALIKFLERGQFGQLQISEAGWDQLIKEQENTMLNTQGALTLARSKEFEYQAQKALQDAKSLAIYTSSTVTGGNAPVASYTSIFDEDTFNYVKKLVDEGQVKDFADSVKNAGIASLLSAEEIEDLGQALINYRNVVIDTNNKINSSLEAFFITAISADKSTLLGGSAGNIAHAFSKKYSTNNERSIQEKSESIYKDDGYAEFRHNEYFQQLAAKYDVSAQMVGKDLEDLQTLYKAVKGVETIPQEIEKNKRALANAIAEVELSEVYTEAINKFTDQFITLSNNEQEILNLVMSEGLNYIDKNPEYLGDFYKKNQELLDQLYGSKEGFVHAWTEAVENGKQEIAEAKAKLIDTGILPNADELFGKGLDAGAISGLSENLIKVFEVSGTEAASTLANSIQDIVNQISNPEDAAKFATVLNSIDWSKTEQIEGLSDSLKELITSTDLSEEDLNELENQMILLAKATRTVDLEKVADQIKSLSKIQYNIKNGEQKGTFSEEDYKTLIDAGVASAGDFVYNLATDSWDYIGGSMEELNIALDNNTKALLGQEDLERGIEISKAARQTIEEVDTVNFSDATSLGNALGTFLEKTGGNNGIVSEDWLKYNQGDVDALAEKWREVVGEAVMLEDRENKLSDVIRTGEVTRAQNNSISSNVTRAMEATGGTLSVEKTPMIFGASEYTDALLAQGKALEVDQELLDKFNNSLKEGQWSYAGLYAQQIANIAATYEEAKANEIDIESVKQLADYYIKNGTLTEEQIDEANKLALAILKQKQGLESLSDSYETWSNNIRTMDKNSDEYRDSVEGMRKAIKQLTNTSKDLSDEFLTNEDTLQMVQDVLDGTEGSVEKLQKAIGQNFLDGLTFSGDPQALIDGILAYNPEIEIGTTINNNEFLNGLYDMMIDADATVAQIQDLFNALGWDPEFQQVPIQSDAVQDQLIEYQDPFTGETKTYKVSAEEAAAGYITVPTPKGKSHNFTKTGFDAKSLASTLNGGGSSKSGGGGGSNPEWENPYDRLYNYLKEINGQLRIREQLEKRYQRLLNTHAETGKLLKENIDNQIASLQEQNRLQKIISDERLKDIRKIQAENTDLNKYAYFDETIGVGGEVQIDWDLINEVDAANDEELGKRIEDYISKMEEWADSRHEAIDAIEDNTDAIIELRETGKEEYKDLEDRALDAIINHQQKIIDEQEKLNDAITEANEALTDAISKNIEKIRQDRQNQETETSLAEKERRLAYLRQDTTGSNAVEIKKLEQDLEKERQNYTDSLIDQSLNDLKEQNDAAAKQREKQIELMQSQLDWQTETGYYVNQVTEMVQKMVAKGIIDETDPLYALLQENEAYYEKTNASRQEWFEELKKTIAEAYVYQENGGTDNGGGIMSNMLTVAEAQDLATFAGLEQQRNEKIRSQGLQDEWPETRMVQNYNNGKQQNIDTVNSNYMQDMINSANSGNWAEVFKYAGMRDTKIGNDTTESFWEAFRMWYNAGQRWSQYASGGLADYTGPAWLDGTKTRPEMVLNARDTQNFLELRDLLSTMASSGTGNSSVGNFYCDIDINVGEVSSDYDVDRIAARIKQSIYEDTTYRNVNAINFLK